MKVVILYILVSLVTIESFIESQALCHNKLTLDTFFDVSKYDSTIRSFIGEFVAHYHYQSLVLIKDVCGRHLPWLYSLPSVTASVTNASLQDVADEVRGDSRPEFTLVLIWSCSEERIKQLEDLHRTNYRTLSVLVLLSLTHGQKALATLKLPLDNLMTFGCFKTVSDGRIQSVGVELWETYRVLNDTRVKTQLVGDWSATGGLVAPSRDRVERRSDLLGADLRCISGTDLPGAFMEYVDGEWVVTGIHLDVIQVLSELLNFTYHFHSAPDGEWGVLKEDGSWSGMMGELVADRGDVVATFMDNTVERAEDVDFLPPIADFKYLMIMKRGSNLGSIWTSYTSEFSTDVWLCVLVVFVVGSFFYAFIGNYSPSETARPSLGESAMVVLAAFAAQSSTNLVTSTSGRIVHLLIFVVALLITMHYTSDLYSKLAVNKIIYPVDSFEAMLKDGSYTLGIMQGWSIQTELEKSNNTLKKRIWKELITDGSLVKSQDEGYQKAMESNKFVFMFSETAFYRHENMCNFIVLPGNTFRFPTGYAVRKKSPLRDVLSSALLYHMYTGGIHHKLRKFWFGKKKECAVAEIEAMSLRKTCIAVYGFVLSMCIALLIFGAEKHYKSKEIARNENTKIATERNLSKIKHVV